MSDKTILEQWREIAYNQQADRNQLQRFWANYFNIEKGIYEQLLSNPDEVVSGTVKELAEKYGQDVLTMVGFLDGINDSLKIPNPIETMDENTKVSLPAEIIEATDKMKFLESIPMWALALLGSLGIVLISFGLILVIYGRFFKIYMYTAVAPLALATFGGTGTSSMGKIFSPLLCGPLCPRGGDRAMLYHFSAFASSGSPAIVDGSAMMKVWNYLQETFFNMALLIIMIFGANSVVKEMFGL